MTDKARTDKALKKGSPRHYPLQARLTESEFDEVRAAARRSKMTMSDFVRRAVVAELRRMARRSPCKSGVNRQGNGTTARQDHGTRGRHSRNRKGIYNRL